MFAKKTVLDIERDRSIRSGSRTTRSVSHDNHHHHEHDHHHHPLERTNTHTHTPNHPLPRGTTITAMGGYSSDHEHHLRMPGTISPAGRTNTMRSDTLTLTLSNPNPNPNPKQP